MKSKAQNRSTPVVPASPSVQGLFEAHLPVRDLDTSIEFYTRVVGLQLAHVAPERSVAFCWIGGAGRAMLGLWKAGAGPQQVTLHVAFRVNLPDVIASPRALRAAGVVPLDFDGRPTDEAIVIAWMPAASVFFRDPDGHLLEFIAMLPDTPRPGLGIVTWRDWQTSVPASSRPPDEPAARSEGRPSRRRQNVR
jgi:lactoylglutathione lyase